MKKVLVVDDEENLRQLYRVELLEEGYDVDVAVNGEQALAKLEAGGYDLITLDVKMPGMDGLEALKRLKQRERPAPVILLSAYSSFKQDFNSWLADDYVVKSADLTELKKKIRYLLAR